MLWLNETNGKKLIEAAKAHKEANIEENAYAESFYCILPEKKTTESVIVNTNTDGTNCVKENGAVALLELMRNTVGKPL